MGAPAPRSQPTGAQEAACAGTLEVGGLPSVGVPTVAGMEACCSGACGGSRTPRGRSWSSSAKTAF
jgi:hypothetical protein